MKKLCDNLQKNNSKGQVMLEFTFSMIIILLLIFGTMMVFRWAGSDLAERRIAHEAVLTDAINPNYGAPADGPLKQIDPFFYEPIKMNAVFGDK